MGNLSNRKKDLIMLVVMIITSAALYYSLTSIFPMSFSHPFNKLLYLALAMVAYIQYAESRNKELRVKPKKGRYSVLNGFTLSVFIMVLMTGSIGFLYSSSITCISIFIAREFGRHYRRVLEKRFLGKIGKSTTKINKSGKAKIGEKEYDVASEEIIQKNMKIKVVDVDGKTIYVKRIK